MLEKNPPPPDQNQDENQDKNENQEQDQNKENQKGGDNQDQDNQNNQDNKDNQGQNQQDNKDQKPEGKESGIPKQHIENLLDAVENQEKGIQKRVQNQKELEQKKNATTPDRQELVKSWYHRLFIQSNHRFRK